MPTYSVAEAKARFSALIDEAMRGPVTITRHGQPVVEMRAAAGAGKPGPITDADVDWLVKRRVGRKPAKIDAATMLSKMRDEDWK